MSGCSTSCHASGEAGTFSSNTPANSRRAGSCWTRKAIPATGSIRLFGRDAYVGAALASVKVTFFESLEGLEARMNDQCVAGLQDYRTFRHTPCYDWRHLPLVLYFEQYERVTWSANC
jgi:hypothetical protein